MYARLITASVQPDQVQSFLDIFGEQLLPEISQEHGFKAIYVLRDAAEPKVTALVLWETEADAAASVDSMLRKRLPKVAGFLAGPPSAGTWEVVLRA